MSTGAPQHRPFVLLTGATGLVGGLVLAELLRCEIPVAVVVRGNRRQSAAERVGSLMQRLEERYRRLFVRPVVLSGDLCTPGLELSEIEVRWIAENCGGVIHSAANVLFRLASEHPDNEPYRTNVDGTRHLLDVMTAAGISEWHYVSTAYISGLRSGRTLESELDVGQEFANDYERSKTMAEQMLRDSCGDRDSEKSQNSLIRPSDIVSNPLIRPAATFSPCEGEKGQIGGEIGIRSLTVYRPSIVIDLHPTTSMQSDQTINTSFAMYRTLSQRFGLPERGEWIQLLGFRGDERKNIVTADWVAKMIAQIYRRPALHGQTYHLTSQTGVSVSELEEGFRAACEEGGEKRLPQRSEATASFNQQAAPFVAAFNPYFRDDPYFDRTNTILAMEGCGGADVPLLTVGQIRDFCLSQTKPTGSAAAIANQQSAWCDFLSAKNAEDPLLQPVGQLLPLTGGDGQLAGGFEHSGGYSITGLTVSGAGGGQWLIEDSPNGLRVHVAAANLVPVRWVAAANTLNQLIDGQLLVSDAMESGLLIVEVDYALDCPLADAVKDLMLSERTNTPSSGLSATFSPWQGETGLVERFSKLITRIQRLRTSHRCQKSEVANVG